MIINAMTIHPATVKELFSTSRAERPQPPFTIGAFMVGASRIGLSYKRKIFAVFRPVVFELTEQYRAEFLYFQYHQPKLVFYSIASGAIDKTIPHEVKDSQVFKLSEMLGVDGFETASGRLGSDEFRAKVKTGYSGSILGNDACQRVFVNVILCAYFLANTFEESFPVSVENLNVFRRIRCASFSHGAPPSAFDGFGIDASVKNGKALLLSKASVLFATHCYNSFHLIDATIDERALLLIEQLISGEIAQTVDVIHHGFGGVPAVAFEFRQKFRQFTDECPESDGGLGFLAVQIAVLFHAGAASFRHNMPP
jgi:hypothetical protein